MLDSTLINVLFFLYASPQGASFQEISSQVQFDDKNFLELKNEGYISEPHGKIFLVGDSYRCVHDGKIIIEPKGRAYIEEVINNRNQNYEERKKYRIATIIAIISLVKSFIPELHVILAYILKLLKPQ